VTQTTAAVITRRNRRRTGLAIWTLVGVLALSLGGCATSREGAEPTTTQTTESLPEPTAADVEESSDGGGSSAPYSEGMEIGEQITIDCGGIPVYALSPSGSSVPESEYTLISATEFGSCRFDLDTDGDGYSTPRDALGDAVYVQGGLLETLDGGSGDVSLLDDPALWTNICDGTRQDVTPPGDWTRGTSCVVDGSIHSIFYLIIGHTPDNRPATVSCGVEAGGVQLDGREDAVETTCFFVLASMFGGG